MARNMATYVPMGLRIVQMLFAVVALGCSSYQVSLSSGWYSYGPVNFFVFTSITGLLVSGLLLVAPMFSPMMAEKLPGLIDIILSGLWSLFDLAAGASLASYGGCRGWYPSNTSNWLQYPVYWGHRRMLLGVESGPASTRHLLAATSAGSVCGTWDALIACGFIGFAAYAASTVYAGLDLKNGQGLVKPRGLKEPQAAPGGPITK